MRAADLKIPVELERTVVGWFGEAGRSWCAALPGVTAGLVERWQLAPDSVLAGATHALVLACARSDGEKVVLKVPFVEDENRAEPDALRLYDGDGAVRLLEHDRQTGAMLLERLVPGTPLVALEDRGRAIDVASALLRRLQRPAPETHRFPRLEDLAAAWAADIEDRHSRRHSALPLDLARSAATLARDLGDWDGPDLVVNRDAHLGNILAAAREPWLLIDPKPVLGEAAFDGSYLVQANLAPSATAADAAKLVARIAAGLAVDPVRLGGWALVRCVDNVGWAEGLGDRAKAQATLAKAVVLAAIG